MDDFNDSSYFNFLRERAKASQERPIESMAAQTSFVKTADVEESIDLEAIPDYIIADRNDNQEDQEIIVLSSDDESSESDVEFVYELIHKKNRRNAKGTQPIATYKEQTRQEYLEAFDQKVRLYGGQMSRCTNCDSFFIGSDNEFQLARRAKKAGICQGCFRLNLCVPSQREKLDFINWLVTKKTPMYDTPSVPSFQTVSQTLKKRRESMVSRLLKHGCDGKNLATTSEMYDLCVENGYKCSITGSIVGFHANRRRRPYWALSIDHRIPLYLSRFDPEAWSKKNLQVMSHAMNSIKGHYSDNEVYRWYKAVLKAKVVEL